jgi:hypothetical protein
MSRFTHVLLGVAVGVLVLAVGNWSQASAAGPTDPPLPLSPAQGDSFVGGTAILFRIQTFPGDSSLWLRVSRSQTPDASDSCGRIGFDVTSKSFTATSDPSVYQAAPSYFAGGWMDTPGTYYWQAFRSSGTSCIASEVRSFTITPGPRLTPPTLLSPAQGESISAGTQLAFQIRTFPSDKSVSLRVSHTPDRDACGKIANDVDSASFSASSDPSVYEAKPVHYPGDWMDTPGTYYWQAYRIVYGNGSDGCVESEVRSLTIAAPPPRTLAAARLEGPFKIMLTVRKTRGIKNVKQGRTYIEGWTFAPRCDSGSCRTMANASSLYSTLGGWTLVLTHSGAVYKKSDRATLLHCLVTRVGGPLVVKVRVTRGAWIGTEWQATQITGSFKHSVRAVRARTYHCKAAVFRATLKGSLLQ